MPRLIFPASNTTKKIAVKKTKKKPRAKTRKKRKTSKGKKSSAAEGGSQEGKGTVMTARGLIAAGLATLGALTVSVGWLGGSAYAGSLYGVAAPSVVGAAGSAPGDFSGPTGVAVNEVTANETGDVYVVDQANDRVERFSSTGSYLGEFDASGSLSVEEQGKAAPSGAFSTPTWIAVDNSTNQSDPSAGDVYVFDSGHNKLEKFTAAGAYLATIAEPDTFAGVTAWPEGFLEEDTNGLAVDAAGDLWVYSGPHFVYEYDDSAQNAFMLGWESAFFTAHPGFGVDASKHVFLVGKFTKTLEKFSVAGVDEGSLSGECEEECTAGIAIDQGSGELFVGRTTETQGSEVLRLDESGNDLQSPFASGGQLSGIGGLAVNAGSGTLYVTDPLADDLKIYPRATVADFTTGGVSDEQPTSAVVAGAVNPSGLESTCEVEYGTSTAYGMSAPCSIPSLAAGNNPVAVTATLTGLVSGETYHYRFAATNNEATGHGEDRRFRLTPAPEVDDQPGFASNVTQSAATLNGTIDPYGIPTSYHFVYGATTAYGSTIPSPDLYTPVNDAQDIVTPQTISGLQPGTTYHFALVATAPGGTITGPDESFTTPGIPLPRAITGAAGGATEGAVTLTGIVDPEGWSTTYRFQYGTSTSYGASWPTVGVQAGQFVGGQPVTIYLQNLQPTTTYHYRLLATNPAGTVYGADQTFTTTAYPTSVIQEAPTLAGPVGKATAPKTTTKGLTDAQKLARALRACKKRDKRPARGL